MKQVWLSFAAILCILGGTSSAQNTISGSGIWLSASSYFLFRQSSPQSEISGDGFSTGAGAQLVLGNTHLAAEVQNFSLHFIRTDKQSPLRYSADAAYRSLSVSVTKPAGIVGLYAGITGVETNGRQIFNYSAGFKIAPAQPVHQSYALTLSRVCPPAFFSIAYAGQQLSFADPLTFLRAEHRYAITAGRYSAAIAYSQWRQAEHSSRWRYVAEGKTDIDILSVELKHQRGQESTSLSGSLYRLSSRLGLMTENLRFGGLDIPQATLFTAAADYQGVSGSVQMNGSVSYTAAYGSAVGSLESWPFASVVTALFVNRLYFKAEGRVAVLSGKASAGFRYAGVQITPSAVLYHIIPSLQLRAWEPQFLVFGVTNARQSSMVYRYAGIGKVQLDIRFTELGMEWQMGIAQLIPLYNSKKSSGAAGQPQPAAGLPRTVRTDGGRWGQVTVTLPLPG